MREPDDQARRDPGKPEPHASPDYRRGYDDGIRAACAIAWQGAPWRHHSYVARELDELHSAPGMVREAWLEARTEGLIRALEYVAWAEAGGLGLPEVRRELERRIAMMQDRRAWPTRAEAREVE